MEPARNSDECDRLPLKRIEISLNNFNSVAVPHHLSLLSKHKAAIAKHASEDDVVRVQNEHINARRVINQMRQLIEEMDTLRRQLSPRDAIKFDRLTEKSMKQLSSAIAEYILTIPRNKSFSDDAQNSDPVQAQLQISLQDSMLAHEELLLSESRLNEIAEVEKDVRDLQELFAEFDLIVKAQAEPVAEVERNCETAAVNVQEGRTFLARAESLNAKWYPVAGALLGGLVAGPVGLVAGIKLGTVALLSGSAVGFTGGKILKKNKQFPT